MQKAVQNTATCLLTIIGLSGPSLSNTAPVPEGPLSRIYFTYHKIISVPVVHPAAALEAGDSQGEPQPDGTVMRHHGIHNIHKGGLSKGPFLLQLETDPATKKPIGMPDSDHPTSKLRHKVLRVYFLPALPLIRGNAVCTVEIWNVICQFETTVEVAWRMEDADVHDSSRTTCARCAGGPRV
jgi:hypothetical protein